MRRKELVITKIAAVIVACALLAAGCARKLEDEHMLLLPVADDPTVSFRVLFNVGSQNDPAGKEGLAALTATLLTQGSTQKHSYEEVLALLYPMAAEVSDQVDKEMTVFSGRTHKDNLEGYYALFKEVLLEPAFKQEDFDRVKTDYLNYIRTTLRYSQDEELGKTALYEFVFAGTPYEHSENGRVQSLEAITLEDVKEFYRTHYTWDNVVIGLGGGYLREFPKRVKEEFVVLPKGRTAPPPAPKAAAIDGIQVEIVEKDASSTAISFGFPIDARRGSKDFYALALATSWLGEHRSSFSHLYDVIREKRGLNYGDYAYVEHFPGGHMRQFPPANVARREQIFEVWLRPVPNEARVFAFRAAMREMEKLVSQGMSQEDFDLTRKFLKSYILHYAPTTMLKLGYALDDRFYGIGDGHWQRYARMLDGLTRDDVNAALKKHFTFQNVKVVFVSPDAEGLQRTLVNNEPSPITYPSEKPQAILDEDVEISTYPLTVKPENVKIVKVEEMFQG